MQMFLWENASAGHGTHQIKALSNVVGNAHIWRSRCNHQLFSKRRFLLANIRLACSSDSHRPSTPQSLNSRNRWVHFLMASVRSKAMECKGCCSISSNNMDNASCTPSRKWAGCDNLAARCTKEVGSQQTPYSTYQR